MLTSFDDAYKAVLDSHIRKLGVERIIFNAALNRTLAKDIYTKENVPACALSSMDGYAFCYEDLDELKKNGLKILGVTQAGSIPDSLPRGYASKIFTGAMLPEGSDSIIIVENAEENRGLLRLKDGLAEPRQFEWVRQEGDNYKKGDLLLAKGSLITPFEIGLLAELNEVFVDVYQRPKIGILATGNELIEVGEERENIAQIRSSNHHILAAMIEQLGGIAILKENGKDEFDRQEPSSLEKSFLELLDECDVVLTTGGMSKGDFDFTQLVIGKYSDIVFHGIRVKPGKPTMFAISKDSKKPILGLPGNPNAASLMLFLFSQAILANLKNQKLYPKKVLAKLTCDLYKSDSRLEFRACGLRIHNGIYEISQDGKKGNSSADIHNLCNPTALAILTDTATHFKAGDLLEVILLRN